MSPASAGVIVLGSSVVTGTVASSAEVRTGSDARLATRAWADARLPGSGIRTVMTATPSSDETISALRRASSASS
jgi:hypothetical protein